MVCFMDNQLPSAKAFHREMDFRLRDTMSGAILNFARTGKPGGNWPAFDAKAPKVTVLGEEVKVIDWPNWKALPLLAESTAANPGVPAVGGAKPRD